jgi:chemotaxis protein histidine kinase CheA
MTSDLEKKLLAGTAYKIFFDELQKHINATRAVFDGESWNDDLLREAMGRFHTIRGGAGFFKLSKLSELAGKLEVALQSGSVAELIPRAAELRELNAALQSEAAIVPLPASSPPS